MKSSGIFRRGIKYLKDSQYRIFCNKKMGLYNSISDKRFLKKLYKAYFGRELDLQNPKTYNEKLQWLKLYNRKPEYTMMVDKYLVRDFVANKIGEEHLIPLLGVWENPDEIDFDKLPNQFVLKCNHDSGGLCICKDKVKLDIKAVKAGLKKGLKSDFYLQTREWPYKDVPRKIIAERYMVDESGTQLKDYKFFCFNGVPKFLFVATDRPFDTKFDFFDIDFHHLPLTNGHPCSEKEILKPQGFDEMLRMAAVLSKNIPHVRVDFYDINGHIYFGEMTFFHHSGFTPFVPEEWDYKFGEMLTLPTKKIE